jgi:DNA helicase-2/ATP-dependent DNA helicase PcrA
MLMGIQDKKGNRKEDEWKYKSAEKAVFTWLNCFGPGKISADDPPSKIFERLSGKGSIQYDRYIKERAKFKNDDIIEVNGQFDELRRESERFATVREWFAHADRVRMMVARDSSKKDPEGVRLSTIHGAKGLEWNTVIVIGVNQHTIPGTKAVSPEDVEPNGKPRRIATSCREVLDEYLSCHQNLDHRISGRFKIE